MPSASVLYSKPRGGHGRLEIDFVGPGANVVLKTETIEHRLGSDLPPRYLDLLEIAACVFCADSSVSRGTLSQPRDGRTWRREFQFSVSVREPSFWEQSEVRTLLKDAIKFMTDDKVEFAFAQAPSSANLQTYFPFDNEAEEFTVQEVVLFSGGLDSLSGALDTLVNREGRIALVTHLSAPKVHARQRELVELLRRRHPGRLLWIPVAVHRKGSRGSESTQRSRSILFSALGFVIARMLGASAVRFFENGIVSQNLSISRPIVGTLASRTTHPATIHKLSLLLQIVADQSFEVTNDYEWMTKTEVVARLLEHGGRDLIDKTVSCNHVFQRRKEHPHCGSCTQCLDRRFAVLANGLGPSDPGHAYAVDPIFGEHPSERGQVLAVDWTRHACDLSEVSETDFARNYLAELTRLARGRATLGETLDKSLAMHRRHGKSVRQVLGTLDRRSIARAEPRSLARLFTDHPRPSEPIESAAVLSVDPPGEETRIDWAVRDEMLPLEVECQLPDEVRVVGLDAFTGVPARLLRELLDMYRDDRDQGRAKETYRSLPASTLADRLGIDVEYVRQIVRRIRNDLSSAYRAVTDARPPPSLLVKTVPKKGYRIDPGTILRKET